MCTDQKPNENAGIVKPATDTNADGSTDFKDVYERYEVQLQKEDDLTNNRVKWLLGTQTILFAAIKVGNGDFHPEIMRAVRFVGLASSIAIGVSILASTLCFAKHRKRLMTKYESVKDKIKRMDYPQLDRCRYILLMGDVAGIALPVIFACGWFFIDTTQQALNLE